MKTNIFLVLISLVFFHQIGFSQSYVVNGEFAASTVLPRDTSLENKVLLLEEVDYDLYTHYDMHLARISAIPPGANHTGYLSFHSRGVNTTTSIDYSVGWRILDNSSDEIQTFFMDSHPLGRRTENNCNNGTCTVDQLDGYSPDKHFALISFHFAFGNDGPGWPEAHHIDRIKISENDGELTVVYKDKNGDDDFWYSIEYTYLPDEMVNQTGTAQENFVVGRRLQLLNNGPLSGDAVIAGFDFDYTHKDHHIKEIRFDVSNDFFSIANYRDGNADDKYSWKIKWLELVD